MRSLCAMFCSSYLIHQENIHYSNKREITQLKHISAFSLAQTKNIKKSMTQRHGFQLNSFSSIYDLPPDP